VWLTAEQEVVGELDLLAGLIAFIELRIRKS
jgi:hypothetical protein